MIKIDTKKRIISTLDFLLIFSGILSVGALLFEFGFYITPEQFSLIEVFVKSISVFFIAQEILRYILYTNKHVFFKERWFEITLVCLLILQFAYPPFFQQFFNYFIPNSNAEQLTLAYLAVSQILFFLAFLIGAMRYNHVLTKVKIQPGAVFALSFAFIIITGTLLLLLPKATKTGISVVDALFTSTSAVCVTGLTTIDVPSTFTPLGLFVITFLIQIGGLGVMTLSTFFALLFAGGLSVRERLFMSDLLSENSIGEVSGLLLKIATFTIVIEAIGFLFLYTSLGGTIFPLDHQKFYSCIFHSVSAFCNAGFSTYPDGMMNAQVNSNYVYLSSIGWLIIFGGLGFPVLSNLWAYFKNRNQKGVINRLSMTTKLVLITTVFLLIFGTISIWFLEMVNSPHINNMSLFDQWFHSLFMSISTRTAGFNTVAMNLYHPSTVLVLLFLMWIGASPSSTGGGVKTTTFAVVLLMIYNFVRKKERVELFNRQISDESIRKAFSAIIVSVFVIGLASVVLTAIEPSKNTLDLLFEVVSAMGTVGLSRNTTPFLGDGGKILITVVMFVGRVGVLTLIIAFVKQEPNVRISYAKETIIIG
ncbi:MAG: portal protein [Candidatus Kapabacteria bacterium]|nr:portal protein [Candidatus Kapabacteria bacterium]